jgi:hypothetical protein
MSEDDHQRSTMPDMRPASCCLVTGQSVTGGGGAGPFGRRLAPLFLFDLLNLARRLALFHWVAVGQLPLAESHSGDPNTRLLRQLP